MCEFSFVRIFLEFCDSYSCDIMKKILNAVVSLIVSAGSISAGNVKTIEFAPDSTTVLKNPLSGWVMYMGRHWDENFWDRQGYDNMPTDEGGTVKVSDYASTAYIRTSWRSLEPEEGKYAWNDPDSRISKLFRSVMDRGMRLAFRIVVDGRDQGQNTPMYVFEAGAEGFRHKVGNRDVITPYPDDPVFQKKYAGFITALAKEFNDPDKVDFIDAYGLGKWGEAHSMDYKDESNKIPVFDWITDLYAKTFTRVPLVINYHRVLANETPSGWEEYPNPDSEPMLEKAIAKGYSLRHDAFGMTGYYKDWEKEFAAKWNFKRPIIMEGGWIVGAHHRYWKDPSRKYRRDHPEDVRNGEYEASRDARVNMMDFRAGNETRTWFQSFGLVKDFVREGGYRLYPSEITLDTELKKNSRISLRHTWKNMGWGYCPTNIPQWNQRYKVAFALSDESGKIVKVHVEKSSDLSTWLKETPVSYSTSFSLRGVKPGTYVVSVALVDVTKGNVPAIQMAVDSELLDKNGWARIDSVDIK